MCPNRAEAFPLTALSLGFPVAHWTWEGGCEAVSGCVFLHTQG